MSVDTQSPIYCHDNDFERIVTKEHVVKAGKLHQTICTIPRNNPVWNRCEQHGRVSPVTMLIAAIHFSGWDSKHFLEAPTPPRSATSSLSALPFFLAGNPADARDLFKKVKICYKMRSIIIHGRWENDPEINDVMSTTEGSLGPFFGAYWRTRRCSEPSFPRSVTNFWKSGCSRAAPTRHRIRPNKVDRSGIQRIRNVPSVSLAGSLIVVRPNARLFHAGAILRASEDCR
jgi:hypothetical protein